MLPVEVSHDILPTNVSITHNREDTTGRQLYVTNMAFTLAAAEAAYETFIPVMYGIYGSIFAVGSAAAAHKYLLPEISTDTKNMKSNAMTTRGSYTKKGTYKKKPSTWKGGKLRMTRSVTMAPEIKHTDYIFPAMATGISTRWTDPIWIPFNPQQGTDWNMRIGRKVKLLKMDIVMKAYVTDITKVVANGNSIICDIWQQNDCRGLAANLIMCYDNTVTGYNYNAPINSAFTKVMKRVRRSMIPVMVTQSDGVAPNPKAESVYLPPPMYFTLYINKVVEFTDVGTPPSTIAGVADVAYHMTCCVENGTQLVDSGLNMYYTVRCFFTDA